MQIVIVTGLSGAGKSTALRALEDIEFTCVDNIPVPLVIGLVDHLAHEGDRDKLAIAIDSRQRRNPGAWHTVLPAAVIGDAIVRKLINDLEEPISFMFYLCNRSGLRSGEAAGLRMSDMAFVDEGLIRVRFSYDGPLKEDKKSEGKVKWVPAPEDCAAFLGPWLAQRKAQDAKPEDRVFPCTRRKGLCFRKEYIEACWELAAPAHVGAREVTLKKKKGKVATEVKPTMTWYQATRHSFVSRHLAGGASLDEVSAAVGHSSPVVTKRFYDHYVRRSFSPKLRAGLGLGDKQQGGKVVPMRKSARKT